VNGYISHRRYHTVGLCPPSPLPEWFAEDFDTVDLKEQLDSGRWSHQKPLSQLDFTAAVSLS
jgi:hypothetical protein